MNNVYSSLFSQNPNNLAGFVVESVPTVVEKQGFKYISNSPSFRSSSVNLRGADGVIRHAYRVSAIMSELDLATDKSVIAACPLPNTNRIVSAYLDTHGRISDNNDLNQLFSLVDLEVSFSNSAKLSASSSANKLRLDGSVLALTNAQSDLHNLLNHSVKENLSVGKQTR